MTQLVEEVATAERADPDAPPIDRAAFEALVVRHHGDLVRVAFAVCGDRELAHEAAQSAWLSAWRNRDRLRDTSRVRGWLVAIAANDARRLIRRERQRTHLERDIDAGPLASGAPPDPDLAAALQRLGPDDRALIAMRFGLGLESPEIAAALGGTASGIRGRLSRLVARLREDLDHD
jgi:DNA-directed RNA polymerase specialized sigma24 family protein